MTTFGDTVYQRGGQPVGNARQFDGWFDADIYFVDYDYGTAGTTGKNSMSLPGKNLQTAIDATTNGDTIYLRPRDYDTTATYPEDPRQITPHAAENFHIDAADQNLSIIGTGTGLSHAGVHKCWIGGYSGLTTPVLSIYAPGVTIENLRAQPPASAATGIFHAKNDATYDAGNLTIYNCEFHDANTTGGINICSAWEVALIGNRFINCDYGILVTSTYSQPQIWEVSDNIFNAEASEVYCNFQATGGIRRFTARYNIHASEQPSAGGANKYYNFVVTSTGIIVGDFFGANDNAAENLATLNSVNMTGCYSSDGLVVETS